MTEGKKRNDRRYRPPSRRRRAERFLPGGRTRRGARRRGAGADQPDRAALRPCRADAGLAPWGSQLLRLAACRPPALRDDRARLRRANALARSLRPRPKSRGISPPPPPPPSAI